jgi:hypothetical protein
MSGFESDIQKTPHGRNASPTLQRDRQTPQMDKVQNKTCQEIRDVKTELIQAIVSTIWCYG